MPAGNWTATDAVLVYLRLSSFFAPTGLKKAAKLAEAEALAAKVGWEAALKQLSCGPHGSSGPCRVHDPDGASILETDADAAWLERTHAFAAAHWPPHNNMSSNQEGSASTAHHHDVYPPAFAFPAAVDEEQPRFSHAWAVGRGGGLTLPNASCLHSDPQIPLQAPSLFHEWHAAGATFEIRGAGPPGTPQLLVGSSRRVSWGLTALALDQADLFRLDTVASRPNQYRLDGAWVPFTNTSTETILVKGGGTVHVAFAETIFGPVVTRLIGDQYTQPYTCRSNRCSNSARTNKSNSRYTIRNTSAQWALLAVPYARPQVSSWSASLALYRAADAVNAVAVLGAWEFPRYELSTLE